LIRRRKIRTDLTTWCEHALAPFERKPASHHKLIIKELEAVARGETPQLMIFMPPGSAKSTYASHLFSAWFLAQRPGLSIIGASNTDKLALSVSRKVQAYVRDNTQELGYSLANESAELWSTTNGGQYLAAGVGGTIAGFRADLAVIDDPVKSREAADSETIREKTWEWFDADLVSRCRPGAAIVVIQTRWHEDDLSGRLLERQAGRWKVLSLPATAVENDPLGRKPGEMLWSDDPTYPYGDVLAERKANAEREGAMRNWWSLYEQDPRPLEGSLFKIGQIGTLDAAPAGTKIVRAWDLASTAQTGTADPDWTVGVKMLRTPEDRFVILDVMRMRGGPEEVIAAIRNTAAADGRAVRIQLPQDPGQAGKAQVLDLTKRLIGHNVQSERPTGDKATRAAPFAAQVNVGNVAFVRGTWNDAMREEMRGFPSGKHDDIVDAASDAFSVLIAAPGPARLQKIQGF